jgi:Na+-transporting methylmalonyl-CoA/oxaloacetate decarboxylase gamma subunit
VKTAALVAGGLAIVVVVLAVFAIRGLRKFVRSVWPHS